MHDFNDYLTKQELFCKVDKFKENNRIRYSDYPLNIYKLCNTKFNKVKIAAAPFKTPDLRGMACVANDIRYENHAILVNSNKSIEEQNYHGFHELIHITFQSNCAGQTFKCYDKVKPTQNRYIEWQANEGAAELLVPYKVLLPLIKNCYNEIFNMTLGATHFCSKYAKIFGVTPIVLSNRLNSLSYEIEQYLNGTPIDDIIILSKNQQEKKGIHVISLMEKEDIDLMHKLSQLKSVSNL